MGLSDADRAMLQQAQEQARARMSGRTIDETGRDISEQRQPEPEPIRTGWYWTGNHAVWVVGPTANERGVYYQTVTGDNWAPMRDTAQWQRVHEQVKASGQGFGWRPAVRTC